MAIELAIAVVVDNIVAAQGVVGPPTVWGYHRGGWTGRYLGLSGAG